jgi:hypothetical protein
MPTYHLQTQREGGQRRRTGRHAAAVGAARQTRAHRPEIRLRGRRLPRLHQPHQRTGSPNLHRHHLRRGRKNVVTIEGLANNGTLHPVQQAWLDEDVAQCGYCQPGQIMQAAAMLKTNKTPTDTDIDAIMNVCRCGTYSRIRAAIKRAARLM